MSDDIIVTQHFDDPLGSVIEIDGECYVKIDDKSGTITRYLEDATETTYHISCDDCSNDVNGALLCAPPYGMDMWTIGYISGFIIVTTSRIGSLPTEISFSNAAYGVGLANARIALNSSEDKRPTYGEFLPKTSFGFVTIRITLNDPSYIHPWL